MRGVCKFFDDKKGFGFITPNGPGKDVFVHYTGIQPTSGRGRRTLETGQTVEYDVQEGQKGQQAVNVHVV